MNLMRMCFFLKHRLITGININAGKDVLLLLKVM